MNDFNRRKFVSCMTVIPFCSFGILSAKAGDLPKLMVGDPLATALAYVETSGNPENTCGNCQLYTGEAESEWGGCAIFPGKLVASSGWCKSWVVKTG